MFTQPWIVYAALAAVAAALTNIFGRIGVKHIDSTFATTMRSAVMFVFMLAACTRLDRWQHWRQLDSRAAFWIVLSGAAGATSWLFGFKALSLSTGTVWRVGSIDKLSVPLAAVLALIILGEKPGLVNWVGIGLIVCGAWLSALK